MNQKAAEFSGAGAPECGNRLLVIDDEPAICEYVATVARGLGFEVQTTATPEEFQARVGNYAPTAVVLDLNLPEADGIELLRFLSDRQCHAYVLIISGADPRVLAAAQRLGVAHGLRIADVLPKPVMLPVLRSALKKIMRRTITKNDLVDALRSGDLLVHYQPIVTRSQGGRWLVEGGEALARWQHSDLGLVMPSEFLGIAEEAGLVGPLTDFVIRTVVRQLEEWRKRGLRPSVAVNVAADQLGDAEFPDRLTMLLQEHGIDASSLALEITETAAMQDRETAMDTLARLRLRGMPIAIDDFGTGHSSLKQLFCMPFSELKIDGSFVRDVAESFESRTMVNAMIQLAHNLNLRVCAEGVETRDEFAFLQEAGCDKLQGYLISKPLTATEFERFLRREAVPPDPYIDAGSPSGPVEASSLPSHV